MALVRKYAVRLLGAAPLIARYEAYLVLVGNLKDEFAVDEIVKGAWSNLRAAFLSRLRCIPRRSTIMKWSARRVWR